MNKTMKMKARSRATLYEPLNGPKDQTVMKRAPSLPLLVRTRIKECSSKQDVLLETEEWLRRRRGKAVVERNGRVRDYGQNILLQEKGEQLQKCHNKTNKNKESKLDLVTIKSFEINLRKKLADKYASHRDLTHLNKSVQTAQIVPALVSEPVYRDRDRGYRPVRPHSVDLGGLAREKSKWLGVVPCQRVRVRECDEPPEEFRRAGIGVCFKGRICNIF